jgi:hypothetical protein
VEGGARLRLSAIEAMAARIGIAALASAESAHQSK